MFSLVSVFGYQLAKLYDSVRGKPFRFDIKWMLFVNAVIALGGGDFLCVSADRFFTRGARPVFSAFQHASAHKIEGRVRHYIWHIKHWSLWLDLRICLKTVFGGIINREKIT
jgi:hypothetical protein